MTELEALLERAYNKCIPDGDCMIWQGAMQWRSNTPMMRVTNSNYGTSLRRAMLSTAAGRKLDHRLMATYTCGDDRCIRLEHLAGVSRSAIQARIHKNYNAADKLQKSAKIAVKARARAKMTMELVREIRALDLPQREIARRYGIVQSTVGTIKRGETWVDHTNPFLRLVA